MKRINLCVFLIFILAMPVACSKSQLPMTHPNDMIIPVTVLKIKYLALGDSYTIGEGVPESDRWPVQ